MRTIVKKISLDPMKSRRFGVIPGSVPVWNTPVGKFYSYEEAKANVFKSNYSLADVTMDFEYVDIDTTKNPMGNYGLVPCDVRISGKFYPYKTVADWYSFLISYMSYKGDEGTAEAHYLMESIGGMIMEDQLKECREMDEKFNYINSLFDNGNAYEWLSEHCFGSGDTQTDSRYVNGDDGRKRGSINIPLLLTSNIDELGEMSIFSDDYTFNVFEAGDAPHEIKNWEVYNRPSVYGDDNKIYQTDDTYIIDSGSTDDEAISIIDDSDSAYTAVKYYDYVVSARSMTYYSNKLTYFGHDRNRVYESIGSGTTAYTISNEFKNGFVIIDGTIYGVEVSNFVQFRGSTSSAYNGREFPVFSAASNFSSSAVIVQYCNVGGKEYIAKDGKFYFKSPDGCESDDGCPIGNDMKKYIVYQGDYVMLNNDGYIVLDEENVGQVFKYPLITSYVAIDNDTYYIVSNKLTKQDGFTESPVNTFTANYTEAVPSWANGYRVFDEYVEIRYSYTVSDNTVVTGLTSSKLLGLKDMEVSVDLLGNQMPGNISFKFDIAAESGRTGNSNRVNTKYTEPYNGMLLEIPYHVGNACELQDVDELGTVGTLLTDMSFSGFSRSDVYISGFTITDNASDISYGAFDDVSKKIGSLFESSGGTDDNPEFVDRVECEMVYHVGAVLTKEEYAVGNTGEGNMIPYYYRIKEGDSSGITYTEHFNVELKEFPYYMDEESSTTVKYYDFESTLNRTIINNDDGNKETYEPSAIFSLNVNMYTDVQTESGAKKMWTNKLYGYDETNGATMTPLGRLDYMIGMTEPQIVEGNIYVDRGINALLEKRLKLCDTMSVDALERYGNNWFKIENYD